MTIKALAFDKDGTLLDFHRTWVSANRAAALAAARGDQSKADVLLRAAGHDPETDVIGAGSAIAQSPTRDIAELWHTFVGGWDREALVTAVIDVYSRTRPVPVDGLRESVSTLHAAGISLAVITNDNEALAHEHLVTLGVTNLFDFVAGYDSGFGAKPEPGALLAFCEQVGCTAREVGFVGDNVHDLETGRRADAGLVVGVLTGTSAREDLAPHADVVLDSIVELPELLRCGAAK